MKKEDVFESALKKAEELEKIDFTKGKGIDIDTYYSALEKIALKNNTIKNDEAENVIKEQQEALVNDEFKAELEERRKRVENFIRTYDPNSELVKGLDLQGVDKMYAVSNYLLNSYIQYVNEMKFNFELTRSEFRFLDKALTREIDYNGEEIFNYVEFNNQLWTSVQQLAEENKSNDSFTFVADIKKILILHHLIKNYTVKGHTQDFILFRNVLYKIAQFNKLFNAYSIIIERIKQDRELWGSALDEVAKQKEAEVLPEGEA